MPTTTELAILGPGISGRSKAISAQKRLNLYMEVRRDNDKSDLVAYGTPGLSPFVDFGNQPARGMWWFEAINTLFVVAYDQLLEVRGDGSYIERGTLETTAGNVSMADNGLQLMIVDGVTGYIYTPTTGDLAYSRTGTLVTVTETLHTRKENEIVNIEGDANIPSGAYIVFNPPFVIGTNALVIGTEYVITVPGTANWTALGADSTAYGTVFTATATTTTGIGTCVPANTWTFYTAASGAATGDIRVVNTFRKITNAYTGVDFPVANTVAFIDSYFVVNVTGTKQFWLSGNYDGFYWDPLQYASKEAYTDNLEAVTVDNGNIVLLGTISQEYWQNNGGFPFPFARISGSPTDVGVVARWSMARCGGMLFYLGRTRRGSLSVFSVQNYAPTVVSTPDLDYLFSQYQNPGDAVAFGYRQNGHEFYQISFQTEGKTWLYDASTQAWSELSSNGGRHYAQWGAQFKNEIVVSDYRTGKLYKLDANIYTDAGDTIVRELITPHTFSTSTFNRLHIYRLRLDMEQGVGLPLSEYQSSQDALATNFDQALLTEDNAIILLESDSTVIRERTNPQIMLQVSRDGGYTYGTEMWIRMGAIGQYLRRAEWRRLGVSRSYVFKFRITDPIKVVIIGAAAYIASAAK
jgi:hypothetical protein